VVVSRAAILAFCFVMSVTMAPPTAADPDSEPAAAAAPEASADGRVPSADPVTYDTPDGWTLALGAKDESQVPVAPLTTAVSSREYLSRGTFAASRRPRGGLRDRLRNRYEHVQRRHDGG
jgi:hypothetical protein